FRAAVDHEDRVEVARREFGQAVRQPLRRFAGELSPDRVSHQLGLLAHGLQHLGMPVPKRDDDRARAAVQVAPARRIPNPTALCPRDSGQCLADVRRQQMAHRHSWSSGTTAIASIDIRKSAGTKPDTKTTLLSGGLAFLPHHLMPASQTWVMSWPSAP